MTVVLVVVLMAVLLVFVVSAIQAGYSKHLDVCSVKMPPRANICMRSHANSFIQRQNALSQKFLSFLTAAGLC